MHSLSEVCLSDNGHQFLIMQETRPSVITFGCRSKKTKLHCRREDGHEVDGAVPWNKLGNACTRRESSRKLDTKEWEYFLSDATDNESFGSVLT